MHPILSVQQKIQNLPFGQSIFSFLVARKAPYFLSIRPKILELKPNFCKVKMHKRRKVENHIKTVHAIAMCNLCEMAGGMCIEVSIPPKYRWIPAGMEVKYVKKAETDLIATCQLGEIDWANTQMVDCFVSVKNTDEIEVMNAIIHMKVSLKKK